MIKQAVVCSICNRELSSNDNKNITSDGNTLCNTCFRHETYRCPVCRKYFIRDDYYKTASVKICASCEKIIVDAFNKRQTHSKTKQKFTFKVRH